MSVVNFYRFSGGINRQFDATKLADGEYFLLINGRVRNEAVEPILFPKDLTEKLPSTVTRIRGIASVGNYLVVAADIGSLGKVYWKLANDDSAFQEVSVGGPLDTTYEVVYFEAIPASQANFTRVSTDGTATGNVIFTDQTQGSPACLLVTDGVTQPRIIFPDGTARLAQTFSQWTQTVREYVPVGIMPVYNSGKLYLIGKDKSGRYTQIFSSVSGRPLDFMVQIDQYGNKGLDEESAGAPSTAHSVSYEEITCISRTTNTSSAILVTTANASWLVTPDYTNKIFGEPTFTNSQLFSTGAINNFCVTDILGDAALIDPSGIRSFNSVIQYTNKGENSPFSARISKLLEGLSQTYVAATTFDNYAHFAVNTIHGAGILVYDTILKQFVSLDLLNISGMVKQFSVCQTTTNKRLFFYTSEERIYEYYAGTGTLTKLYLPEIASAEGGTVKLTRMALAFSDCERSGIVEVTAYADRIEQDRQMLQLADNPDWTGELLPVPFEIYTNENIQPVVLDFRTTGKGSKVGAFIEWDFPGKLLAAWTEAEFEQKADIFHIKHRRDTPLDLWRVAFIGNDCVKSSAKYQISQLLKRWEPRYIIGCGNHILDGNLTYLSDYYDGYHQNDKIRCCGGDTDYETLPHAFFDYVHSNATSNFLVSPYAEVFFYNTHDAEPLGYQVGSVQATLLAEKIANSVVPFKIVVMARPPYSSGSYPGAPDLRLPFAEMGVNLVLSSAVASYERLEIDSVTYVVNGFGGSALTLFGNSIVAGSAIRYNSDYGYLRATISRTAMQFYAFRQSNNTVVDAFTLSARL